MVLKASTQVFRRMAARWSSDPLSLLIKGLIGYLAVVVYFTVKTWIIFPFI